MPPRALAQEDKAARRADILNAARELFLEDSHQLPSVARIAQAAGLAKGTVYLYFTTKEDIFLALLGSEFEAAFDQLDALLAIDQPLEALLAAFLDTYAAYLDANPEFLRLASMSASVLELHADEEQGYAFKYGIALRLIRSGKLVEIRLPTLGPGQGAALLLRTYAVTLGLWQTVDYPERVKQRLTDPTFAVLRPDFRTELAATLTQLWRGTLAQP